MHVTMHFVGATFLQKKTVLKMVMHLPPEDVLK